MSSFAWQDLIRAAADSNFELIKSLIIDYYYPFLVLDRYKESSHYIEFVNALKENNLVEQYNKEISTLQRLGVGKDMELVRSIGEQLNNLTEEDIIQENEIITNAYLDLGLEYADAQLIVFPDIHTCPDTALARLKAIYYLWQDGDMVLIEGEEDKGDDHKDYTFITHEILNILARKKVRAVIDEKDWSTHDNIEITKAMYLFMDKFFPNEIHTNKNGKLYFPSLPYKDIRQTGWDIDLINHLKNNPKEIRNASLVTTGKKYLENKIRIFIEAGAGHIPHTVFEALQIKKNYLLDTLLQHEAEAILYLKKLHQLPSSLEDFFSDSVHDKEKVKGVYDFIISNKYTLFKSKAFKEASRITNQYEMKLDIKDIKCTLNNPGIYDHLFDIVKTGTYEDLKNALINLYGQLLLKDKQRDYFNSLVFLLHQTDFFECYNRDIKSILESAQEKDIDFIKLLVYDIENNSLLSMGLRGQNLSQLITMNNYTINNVDNRIKFIHYDGTNFKQSLMGFLLFARNAEPHDVILIERLSSELLAASQIGGISRLILRLMVAKKCEALGMRCTPEQIEEMMPIVADALDDYTIDENYLLYKNHDEEFVHLTPFSFSKNIFADFGGPISPAHFDTHNQKLLSLIKQAYENHEGTIWIFTSAERIPDFADLRRTLLNDIVQEEIISPTDIGLNAEIKGNFQLYNFERSELDPHNLWLPLLPHELFKYLNNKSFFTSYSKNFISRQKEYIRSSIDECIDK